VIGKSLRDWEITSWSSLVQFQAFKFLHAVAPSPLGFVIHLRKLGFNPQPARPREVCAKFAEVRRLKLSMTSTELLARCAKAACDKDACPILRP